MPFLRFRRWPYLTPLAPHVDHCQSGRSYRCTGEHEGVIDVPYAQDVEELLNPLGDRESDYVVAWDKYGVTFDAAGKQISPLLEAPQTTNNPVIMHRAPTGAKTLVASSAQGHPATVRHGRPKGR